MLKQSPTFSVLASYSTVQRVERDAVQLPPLTETLTELCGSRIRRVDRYIELCLLGALNCVGARDLPENTAVYLATGNGTVSAPTQAMNNIFSLHQPPKPLHFVNTLGNTACYYLTRALAVKGQTLVVSQENSSFEAALFQACVDVAAGAVEAALVGGIDEVVLPFADQALRAGAPDARALLEGSHWILLSRRRDEGVAIQNPAWFTGLGDALNYMEEQSGREVDASFSLTEAETTRLQQQGFRVRQASAQQVYEAYPHPVYSGATLVEMIQTAATRVRFHLSRTATGYCVTSLGQGPVL